MLERLVQFLDYKGDTIYSAERLIGVPKGTIYRAVRQNTNISSSVLEKISSTYLDLNINWLVSGKGEMTIERATKEMEEFLAYMRNRTGMTDAQITARELLKMEWKTKELITEEIPKAVAQHELDEAKSSKIVDETTRLTENSQLELVKKQGFNEFFSIREYQFIVVCPLVEVKSTALYCVRYFDHEFMEELPRQAIVLNRLYWGDYRSFEIGPNAIAGSGEFTLLPGMIVTGPRYDKKLSGRKMEYIEGRQCVIVLKDRIIFTQVTQTHKNGTSKTGITCPDPTNAKKDLLLYSDDIVEMYDIEVLTQNSSWAI